MFLTPWIDLQHYVTFPEHPILYCKKFGLKVFTRVTYFTYFLIKTYSLEAPNRGSSIKHA